MDTPAGKVIAVHRHGRDTRVTVDIDAAALCARCAAGKGCGAGLFGGTRRARRIEALLEPGDDVVNGDIVNLTLAPKSLLQASVVVYGWPLTGALGGALLALGAQLGDAAAAALALLGLGTGAVFVQRRLARPDCLQHYTPTASRST